MPSVTPRNRMGLVAHFLFDMLPWDALCWAVSLSGASAKGSITCTATCPSKSITLRHFTDKQLMSEMIGAMEAMFELVTAD